MISKSSARKRGGTFHQDNIHQQESAVHYSDEPPNINILSIVDDIPPNKSNINHYDGSDDLDEQSFEETLSRGRSRSRSIHENDGLIPYVLNQPDLHSFTNQNDNPNSSSSTHSRTGSSSEDKNNNSTDSTDKETKRSGPLPKREVLALKKGLEEANLPIDPIQSREEEEERIAAESEKRKRLQKTIPVGGKDNSIMNNNSSSSSHSRESDAVATRRAKILMLGDSGVGKSSLILRWTMDTFSPSLTSTVGVNFKSKKVTVASELTQVQVWDTAGQENFHKITTSYYKGAQGILLVYDVTDRKTLENVEYWIKNIKSHASDTVQIALIGNKTDLRVSEQHNISHCATERGEAVATKFGIPFFETSAKDSMNVDHAFLTLVRLIVESNCSTVIACNNTKVGSSVGHATTTATALSPSSSSANGGGLGGSSEVGRSDGKSNLNGAKEKKSAFPLSHQPPSKNSSKLNGSSSNSSSGSGQASSDKEKCTIQ